MKGIEPSYAAWEATVLPLNYTRNSLTIRGLSDVQLNQLGIRIHDKGLWQKLVTQTSQEAVRWLFYDACGVCHNPALGECPMFVRREYDEGVVWHTASKDQA